jgi:hypothetical protein
MNLVLYGIDRELLPRLAAKLPPSTTLHWQDSNAPTSAQDLQRGPQTWCCSTSGPACGRLERAGAAAAADPPDLPLVAVGATSAGQVEGVVIALRAGLRDVLDLDSDNAASRRPCGVPGLRARQRLPSTHKARLIVLLGVRAGVGTQHPGRTSFGAGAARAPGPGRAVQQDGLLMELAQPPATSRCTSISTAASTTKTRCATPAASMPPSPAPPWRAMTPGWCCWIVPAAAMPCRPRILARCCSACAACSPACCAMPAAARCGSCRRCCWTRPTRSAGPMPRSPRWYRWTRP